MLEIAALVLLPSLTTAIVAVTPVYLTLRKVKAELSESREKLTVAMRRENSVLDEEQRINIEAQWKRVLKEREEELIRLRAKDDEQESKIGDLLNRHIECKENEARTDEKLKTSDQRRRAMNRQIKALTTKLLELDNLLKGNNVNGQGSTSAHQALLGYLGTEEEEAGSGPVQNLRTDPSKAGG